MISPAFKYPIIKFKEGDKNIYSNDANSTFGFVSTGGGKFYKDITIIDSDGHVFKLIKARIRGVASLWMCIKHFQKLWEMDLEFKEIGAISLSEFKTKIIDHVSKYPKNFSALDAKNEVIKMINEKTNFKDLIRMFR